MFPGDTLMNGTQLKLNTGAQCGAFLLKMPEETEDPPVIYCSPTINYASHPIYAKPFPWQGKLCQIAFQCRVKPNSFVKFQGTLPGRFEKILDPAVKAQGRYDLAFPENELEWITRSRDAIVPYRVLVRWFDKL